MALEWRAARANKRSRGRGRTLLCRVLSDRNVYSHALVEVDCVRRMALPLIACFLANACSHPAITPSAGDMPDESRHPCQPELGGVDTTSWTPATDSTTGAEFVGPPSYYPEYLNRARRVVGGELASTWVLDYRGIVGVAFLRLRAKTIEPAVGSKCLLQTASGPAVMFLYRLPSRQVYGHPVEPHLVTVDWPVAVGQRRRFIGRSLDDATRNEHIRIAMTVRWPAPDSASR